MSQVGWREAVASRAKISRPRAAPAPWRGRRRIASANAATSLSSRLSSPFPVMALMSLPAAAFSSGDAL
jgi:hypothetical protein